MKKISLVRLTTDYLNVPYKLGGKNKDEGLDCVSFIRAVAREQGIDVPDTFNGFTLENYTELWEEDKKLAITTIVEWLSSWCDEIAPNLSFVGDYLLVKNKANSNMSVGLHAGREFLAVFVEGIRLYRMSNFIIMGAYRPCQQLQ